jgi:hypothetical protein
MQKNDQNPPAKNPSCHVKVQLVCGDGPLYIITFSKKTGIWGQGRFPPEPTHQHTRRHADTPTRRHADRGHAAHTQPTHTANTHTGRGLEGGDGRANTGEGASSIKAHCSPKHQPLQLPVICISGNPALLHSLHTTRGGESVMYGSTPVSVTSYLGRKPPFPALYVPLLLL